MKRIIPIVFVAVLLSSCLETQSHYTPEIATSKFVTNHGDTLKFRFDELSGLYNLDSLHVGDTITGAVGFASLGNNLLSAHVAWDSTRVRVWSEFTPDVLNVLLSNSDTAALNLYLPIGYNYLGFPLYLVPRQAGSTSLKLTVVTDSKYSPAEENLVLNIIQ